MEKSAVNNSLCLYLAFSGFHPVSVLNSLSVNRLIFLFPIEFIITVSPEFNSDFFFKSWLILGMTIKLLRR